MGKSRAKPGGIFCAFLPILDCFQMSELLLLVNLDKIFRLMAMIKGNYCNELA